MVDRRAESVASARAATRGSIFPHASRPSRILVCLVAAFAGSASAVPCRAQLVPPPWARSLPSLPDRPSHYQGLGATRAGLDLAESWRRAEAQAVANLSMEISVQVDSRVEARVRAILGDAEPEVVEKYEDRISASTRSLVEDVTIQRYNDVRAGVLYAYASIAKQAVHEQFTRRRAEAIALAAGALSRSEEQFENGQLQAGILALAEGLRTVLVIEATLPITTTSADVAGELSSPASLIAEKIRELPGRILLEARSGDRQAGWRGLPLPLPLVGCVGLRTESGVAPASGLPLVADVIAPAEANVPSEAVTGADGCASLPVHSVDAGQASNYIRLSLDPRLFSEIGADVRAVLQPFAAPSIPFTFFLLAPENTRLGIRILEREFGRPVSTSAVTDAVVESLTREGLQVQLESALDLSPDEDIRDAIDNGAINLQMAEDEGIDFLVLGHVDTSRSSRPRESMYLVEARGRLDVVRVATGSVVASVNVPREVAGAGSYEAASARAVRQIAEPIARDLTDQVLWLLR